MRFTTDFVVSEIKKAGSRDSREKAWTLNRGITHKHCKKPGTVNTFGDRCSGYAFKKNHVVH